MIYEMLQTGQSNAQSATNLARVLGVHKRDVSRMVERERRAGYPICATSNGRDPGYFLPVDREDMRHYINRLRHREAEIAETRAACEKTLKQPWPPQLEPEELPPDLNPTEGG